MKHIPGLCPGDLYRGTSMLSQGVVFPPLEFDTESLFTCNSDISLCYLLDPLKLIIEQEINF